MRSLIAFFLKVWAHFLCFLPRRFVRWLGSFIGFLWIDLFKVRRKVILDNLKIAYPEWSDLERQHVGRESVYNMGRNFSEFFMIPGISQAWIKKNVVVHGAEFVEQAKTKKKGIFFLTLHLGHGDMAANIINLNHCDFYIITKVFKNKFFNDLWFSIRGAHGVKYIDAHGPNNAFEILKALKKNSGIAFVVDQYMGKPYGILTRFFGKNTGTAYGLGLFYQKTKSPVVPVYTYEGEDKKMHLVFEPMMDLEHLLGEDKDQNTKQLTQAFCDKLEQIIRKHPEQWMWVHRRWKKFE